MSLTPFHAALQARDLEEARVFYRDVLGCSEGRSSALWVDFNLYGHQLVCHLNPGLGRDGRIDSLFNPVDGDDVPVPHCGVVLERPQWDELAERLRARRIAFAASTVRSASAMSGRRSSKVEGTPGGTVGTFAARPVCCRENSAGGLPISTAIACSSVAREMPELT